MIDENIKELFAKIEAVLFAVGEPISIEKLAEALDMDADDTPEDFERLRRFLACSNAEPER